MKKHLRTLIFFLIFPFLSNGQVDSSAIFEKAKKQLSHPIQGFTRLINYDSLKFKRDACIEYRNIYYAGKDCAVNAIFEGKVVSVFQLGDIFGIITKFGKYFIVYFGLTKPIIKKDDYVLKDQFLSTLMADNDQEYELELRIVTEQKDFDPSWWIK